MRACLCGLCLLAGCEAATQGDQGEVTSAPEDTRDCFALYESDDGLDGTIEAQGLDRFDLVWTDRILWSERDHDMDGRIDETWAFAYDDAGNRVSVEHRDGEGALQSVERYTYDSEGRLARYDREVHAGPDTAVTSLYTYDSRGNRIRAERDEGSDGTIDWRKVTTYDSQDRPILDREAIGADGNIDIQTVTTYRDPVLWIGSAEVHNGDFRYLSTFETDTPGAPEHFTVDYGMDGTIDSEQHIEWLDKETQIPSLMEQYSYAPPYDDGYPFNPRVYRHEFRYDGALRFLGQRVEEVDLQTGELLSGWQDTWSYSGSCP